VSVFISSRKRNSDGAYKFRVWSDVSLDELTCFLLKNGFTPGGLNRGVKFSFEKGIDYVEVGQNSVQKLVGNGARKGVW